MRSPNDATLFGLRRTIVLAVGVAGLAGFVPGSEPARAEQLKLQLEVYINGIPAQMIGSFIAVDGTHLSATPNELEDVGLHIAAAGARDQLVSLEAIPDLAYTYDEALQRVSFVVDNKLRRAHSFDLSPGAGTHRPPRADWGSVVNYDLLSSASSGSNLGSITYNSTALTLDGRAFSPFGTFEQSGIVDSDSGNGSKFLRLETSFQYSDPVGLTTYRLGDTIGSSLPWTRPTRLGGVQIQNNFGLRPDLVTRPLPTLGGTAAVPSSVDLYINNIRTFSQDIGAGPFNLNNIPTLTGEGNAQLVIRDASGNVSKTTVPFYSSPDMLASGKMDWSVEAGLPRLSYGSGQDSYVGTPIAAVTLRRGIFDGLTVQSHAEGGAGLLNGGIGAVAPVLNKGALSLALSGSTLAGKAGLQSFVAYETKIYGLSINLSSQRSFGIFNDLASATARLQPISLAQLQTYYGLFGYVPVNALNASSASNLAIYQNARPPRALDRISISSPLAFDRPSSLAVSFINFNDSSGVKSRIAETTYSRSLPFNSSIFGTIFRNFGTQRNTGFFLGLNVQLNQGISASTGYSGGTNGGSISSDLIKPLGTKSGDYGWHLHDSEGASPYRSATLSYRSDYGTINGTAGNNRSVNNGVVELRGSLVAMKDGMFASNWIEDGFAVVRTGVPDVPVLNENREIGVTDSRGLLLVPSLRSYQTNKVDIDPTNLPVDTELETTREFVAPADRAGISVNFAIKNDSRAAIVSFVDRSGAFLPAGSTGHLQDGAPFIVGYDGEAFIRGLQPDNLADMTVGDGSCQARFSFVPKAGTQVRIAQVLCQSSGPQH